jgi:hypothetical protein
MKGMIRELAFPIAQAVGPNEPLSTDLRWLRFPQGTPETITMFFAVLVAVVLAVIVTLLIQGWVQSLLDMLPRRIRKARAEEFRRLEPELRAALERLIPFASIKAPTDLIHDAASLEHAIAAYVAQAPLQEDLSAFTRLRRRLGMTVMNPAIKVASTRQLLPDLTVRVVATVGAEWLDLYCPILDISERHLLIDAPYQAEISNLLTQHPEVFLIYWREHDGETAFRVRLVPIHSGHMSAFRCDHALQTEDAAARQDFRLTIDLPATYQFMDRQSLIQHKPAAQDVVAIRGEARLVNLSNGGAALVCDRPLSEHGFAQLHFALRDVQPKGSAVLERPVRVMMEVLSSNPTPGGKTLVHGQFRGISAEARGWIHSFLMHEQYKRIQMREQVVVNTAAPNPATSALAAPVSPAAGEAASTPAARASPAAAGAASKSATPPRRAGE